MYENFWFKQQMQDPYTPSATTTDRWAQEDQAKQAAADQQAKANRIAEIKSRIAEIDRLIAEKHGPYAAAAEAARTGNMTPYLQLLTQQQAAATQKATSAKGIENELYNAEKYIPNLDGSDEERRAAVGTIQTTLAKAVELGGESIKEKPSYKRLAAALAREPAPSIEAKMVDLQNAMWDERENLGYVSDETYKAALDLISANKGSEKIKQLQQVAEKYKKYTKSSTEARKVSKAKGDAAYKAWPSFTGQTAVSKAQDLWRKYLDEGHPITKYYELLPGSIYPRKKVK